MVGRGLYIYYIVTKNGQTVWKRNHCGHYGTALRYLLELLLAIYYIRKKISKGQSRSTKVVNSPIPSLVICYVRREYVWIKLQYTSMLCVHGTRCDNTREKRHIR